MGQQIKKLPSSILFSILENISPWETRNLHFDKSWFFAASSGDISDEYLPVFSTVTAARSDRIIIACVNAAEFNFRKKVVCYFQHFSVKFTFLTRR